MWIKTTKENVVRVNPECIDEPVEFSDSHTAQVTEDVGKRLIQRYDFIISND